MFEFRNVKYKDIISIDYLCLEENKLTALIGPSGSGKTSILKMLNKIITNTSGTIKFYGKNLKDIDTITHRREVLMLSQNPAIFSGSIRDNLNIGLKFQDKPILNDEILKEFLKKVHLDKDLDLAANTLSGGEKQRLALARVLILDPKVYLLDEPSSALDKETEDILISNLKSMNKTVIIVTHSKDIANKYADKIIEVSKGCVKYE